MNPTSKLIQGKELLCLKLGTNMGKHEVVCSSCVHPFSSSIHITSHHCAHPVVGWRSVLDILSSRAHQKCVNTPSFSLIESDGPTVWVIERTVNSVDYVWVSTRPHHTRHSIVRIPVHVSSIHLFLRKRIHYGNLAVC